MIGDSGGNVGPDCRHRDVVKKRFGDWASLQNEDSAVAMGWLVGWEGGEVGLYNSECFKGHITVTRKGCPCLLQHL